MALVVGSADNTGISRREWELSVELQVARPSRAEAVSPSMTITPCSALRLGRCLSSRVLDAEVMPFRFLHKLVAGLPVKSNANFRAEYLRWKLASSNGGLGLLLAGLHACTRSQPYAAWQGVSLSGGNPSSTRKAQALCQC